MTDSAGRKTVVAVVQLMTKYRAMNYSIAVVGVGGSCYWTGRIGECYKIES